MVRRNLVLTKEGELEATKKEDKAKNSNQEKLYKSVSVVSELGLSIALPIAGGAFLGKFIDSYFHTEPKMSLSFIFLGLILGITNMYFIIKRIDEN